MSDSKIQAPTPEQMMQADKTMKGDEMSMYRFMLSHSAALKPDAGFKEEYMVVGPGCVHAYTTQAVAEQAALDHMEKDDSPYFVVRMTPFMSPEMKAEMVEFRKAVSQLAAASNAAKRGMH